MKKLLFLLLFTTTLVFGQIPQGISHRGTVYTTNGTTTTIVADTLVKIRISILDGSSTGTPVYSEFYTIKTNTQGQYSLNIGTSNEHSTLPFNEINWGVSSKYLKVEIDPSNTATFESPDASFSISGSNQLMSVPYALYSQSSGNATVMINSIADLRLYPVNLPQDEGKIIYLKGYYNLGDGGEGFFIFKGTDQIKDTGGIHIKPQNISPTDPGRWVRLYDGPINAMYFGIKKYPDIAQLTDPSFSNSDRIQAAIDYIANSSLPNSNQAVPPHFSEQRGNLLLYFPSGHYFIDKPIILKTELELKGEQGTLFEMAFDRSYPYMFEIDKGPIQRLKVENLQLDLGLTDKNGSFSPRTIKPQAGGFHFKANNDVAEGGLWGCTFKNIKILTTNNHGIYIEGGESYNTNSSNYDNQYLTFENIWIVRTNPDIHCLKITGAINTTTFLGCNFEIPYVRNTDTDETPVDIGTDILITSNSPEPPANANVISFINCALGGHVQYGVIIENSENITFDNCWIEDTEFAFAIKNAEGINILNSRFANASGIGSLKGNIVEQGLAAGIVVENSHVNIENNFIQITDPSNYDRVKGEVFIRGIGTNNVINAINNCFHDIRNSDSYGIVQYVSIEDVFTYTNPTNQSYTVRGINSSGKKLVFVSVDPPGSIATNSSNQIYRINSTIAAGETIFIRADKGEIRFYPMSTVNELNGKNIVLNGLPYLDLKNGQCATFIKIDGIYGNEKCAYQLVSAPNMDSGWINVSSFSNGFGFNNVFSSYDADSTVRYRKKNGIVYLDGNIKGGSAQTNGTGYLLLTLPEGYRPARKESFAIVRAGNAVSGVPTTTVVGRIDIDTYGKVYGVNYSNVWNSLSGIQFFTD